MQELLAARRVEQRGVQIRPEDAGRDGVDGDAVRRPFDRQRARQPRDGRLARHVRRHFEEPDKRRQRRDGDDPAGAARDHVAAEHLAARSVPVRFVSRMRLQSASSISSVGDASWSCPRQHTRMSTPAERRDARVAQALERRRRRRRRTARAASGGRAPRSPPRPPRRAPRAAPVATTSAPASARPSASARPMPLVPPTTTARRPDRSNRLHRASKRASAGPARSGGRGAPAPRRLRALVGRLLRLVRAGLDQMRRSSPGAPRRRRARGSPDRSAGAFRPRRACRDRWRCSAVSRRRS